MSRFAKIGEEAVRRQSELSGEEFRLYCLIKFHTWNDSGVCNKNLRELAELYALDYDNTTRRYKSLRQKGWCENTKKGIRCAFSEATAEITVPHSQSTVKNAVADCKNYSSENSQTAEITVSDCKNYSLEDSETVKNAVSLNRNKEPFKDQQFIDSGSREKVAAAAVETKDQKSIFSLEECLRYAEFCVRRGDPIKSVEALARYAYQSGADDAFIEAAIYPATVVVESPPPTVFVEPRTVALEVLLDLVRDGVDIENQKQFYAPEDWAILDWAILMEEINNYVE